MRAQRIAGTGAAALLLAGWAACAVLHVRQVAPGRLAWVGVYAAAPVDSRGYPAVRGFWPGTAPAATGGLEPGDRLVRVGGDDLRGVGPVGFAARAWAAADSTLRVPVAYERDGLPRRTTIELVRVPHPWRMLPLACGLVATGALVVARRRDSRVARVFFLAALAFATHWTFFPGGPRWQTFAWAAVFCVASLAMLPLVLRAALLFPPDAAPPGGRLPWWPWVFAAFGPVSFSWVFGTPLSPEMGVRGAFILNVAFIVTLLVVMGRNFRRAGAPGRRQLKWVLLGMWLGTVPVLLADVAGAVRPSLARLHDLAAIAEIAIPVSIAIAIARANLFDVDRLISGTAVYSILSIGILAAALFGVPRVATVVSAGSGLDPDLVEPLLSVVAAAGIVPASRALRPRVERVLLRERHSLRAGVDDLLRDLAGAASPDALFRLLCDRLDALVRPRGCVLLAPLGDAFAPVACAGWPGDGRDTPGLPAASAIVAALGASPAPLHVRRWARGRPPGERAALEELQASLLVPVRRGAALAAILALGAKRSGDVYTPTDLALLAAVADKVSGELLRFDTGLILQRERAMREALNRYVPAPVAARVARGEAIEGGERDVSVLFVDIRGYTALSETRGAGELFSLVSRYTEAVSAVIQRHGGTVVEFLGDGLMAVFGAPEPIPDHAGAAVRAACEVADAVRRLEPEGGGRIMAGVGVASGRAFVGNVRTNDRLVYTAIGDVVNVASRIERLTRQLDAAVAIDGPTHRLAGALGARFARHAGLPIRGRAEPVDVYALPHTAA